MSVLINMEMPKGCATCPMLEGDSLDGLCHAASRWLDDDVFWTWYVYPEGDVDDSKPCNCPLLHVPPHGDLVERDALMELYADEDDLRLKNMKVPIAVIRQNIMDAPTIIPAEEVYGQYTDTAGNLHWTGTHSGEHIIRAEEGER